MTRVTHDLVTKQQQVYEILFHHQQNFVKCFISMVSPLVSDHYIQNSLPRVVLIAEYHRDGIIYYIVFSAFSDFNVMLCRFIYCVIYIYMYDILLLLMSSVLFMHLPMEGHLGYFQFGAI